MILLKIEQIEILETASEYLIRLNNAIPSIVGNFRTGNEAKAYTDVAILSEGLQWINDVFKLTSDVHNINVISIKEIYFEFIEALENNDSVLLADLLEYELTPKVQEWKTSLDESLAKNAN